MTRKVDHLVVHCSATRPDQDIGSAEIDRWHRQKGWWGCGYHYVIRRDGRVESAEAGFRCRPLDKAGAHVGDCGPGWNGRSIGICLIGGVNAAGKAESTFTLEQFDALFALLDDLRDMVPNATILGHRDLIRQTGASPKDCPSFDVRSWMAGLDAAGDMPRFHKVVAGDTVWGIARRYGVSPDELVRHNPGVRAEAILPIGTMIILP